MSYVLVTSEMRIYGHKRYAYRKVAERHATDGLTVMSVVEYYAAIEGKTRRVQNVMTGAWVDEPLHTPYSCSVSSESYWTM